MRTPPSGRRQQLRGRGCRTHRPSSADSSIPTFGLEKMLLLQEHLAPDAATLTAFWVCALVPQARFIVLLDRKSFILLRVNALSLPPLGLVQKGETSQMFDV